MVYKSGLAFFLTAKTKKLAICSTVQYSTPVLNICKILTLVLTWSQTCDICPSCVFMCPLLLPVVSFGSGWGHPLLLVSFGSGWGHPLLLVSFGSGWGLPLLLPVVSFGLLQWFGVVVDFWGN